MKIRYRTNWGQEEKGDVVHVVPVVSPTEAGILFKNGDHKIITWKDVLGIYAHD